MPEASPSRAKSLPAGAAQRSRCTDTHLIACVGEFSVRRVGGIVALHLGCPAGRFVFHVRERSFVRHARAATDDQGNPFRTLQEIERETSENAREQDESSTSPQSSTSCVLPTSFKSSDRAAWEFLGTHLDWAVGEVADRFGLSQYGFSNWIAAHHPRELTALRRAAGIALRPMHRRKGGQR